MAAQSESRDTWPIARQLRRVRTLYAGGVLLWAASTTVTAWSSPGSRSMWTSLLLLVVFTGLLGLSSWWLRRLGTERAAAGEQRPAVAVRASVPARHARV